MADNNFTPVNINTLIIKRVDKIFLKAGFSTRASYIQHKLREAVEKDLEKFGVDIFEKKK